MPKSVPVLPGIQPGRSAYSQVVEANGLVFVAGQVGEDHATGEVAPGGIEAETRVMFANVGIASRPSGSTLADVVKTTVYLVDMADWAAYDEVFARGLPGRSADPGDGRGERPRPAVPDRGRGGRRPLRRRQSRGRRPRRSSARRKRETVRGLRASHGRRRRSPPRRSAQRTGGREGRTVVDKPKTASASASASRSSGRWRRRAAITVSVLVAGTLLTGCNGGIAPTIGPDRRDILVTRGRVTGRLGDAGR